jgi:hypothetical protein
VIDKNRTAAMNTRSFKLKESDRAIKIGVGGAVAVGGGAVMHFFGGAGLVGIVGVAVGLVLVGMALVRGSKPVVIVEPTMIVLRFAAERRIPFHAISKVEQLPSNDVVLALHDGERLDVKLSRLAEEDSAWVRKALRREVRLAAS